MDSVELEIGDAQTLGELARESGLARAADPFDVDPHGASVGGRWGALLSSV